MDVQALLRLDADLKDFVDDIFVSLRRKGWQERSFCYMTGLMLDGRRKSVQPMAQRLDEPNEQSLHHFVANTPWDPVPVRRQLARRMQQVIDPSAWVFDDTGFVKDTLFDRDNLLDEDEAAPGRVSRIVEIVEREASPVTGAEQPKKGREQEIEIETDLDDSQAKGADTTPDRVSSQASVLPHADAAAEASADETIIEVSDAEIEALTSRVAAVGATDKDEPVAADAEMAVADAAAQRGEVFEQPRCRLAGPQIAERADEAAQPARRDAHRVQMHRIAAVAHEDLGEPHRGEMPQRARCDGFRDRRRVLDRRARVVGHGHAEQ